jgi:hypothetical protein
LRAQASPASSRARIPQWGTVHVDFRRAEAWIRAGGERESPVEGDPLKKKGTTAAERRPITTVSIADGRYGRNP